MLVRDVEFAAIDFESAGVSRGQTDVPIQIGMAALRGGVITDPFRSYLQSDRPIAWSARKVHGIEDADLADAPTLLALWPELRTRFANRWIVSHGAGTEKRFLRAFSRTRLRTMGGYAFAFSRGDAPDGLAFPLRTGRLLRL